MYTETLSNRSNGIELIKSGNSVCFLLVTVTRPPRHAVLSISPSIGIKLIGYQNLGSKIKPVEMANKPVWLQLVLWWEFSSVGYVQVE